MWPELVGGYHAAMDPMHDLLPAPERAIASALERSRRTERPCLVLVVGAGVAACRSIVGPQIRTKDAVLALPGGGCVAVFEALRGNRDAYTIARRVGAGLRAPVGLAIFPYTADDAGELLARAAVAMTTAQAHGEPLETARPFTPARVAVRTS
ncbi:MAG: hypothetical protein JOZ38_02925, partial [Candidatus Eremiobacteraeota bacterium]|nr:hypothetical protein [Candidatus Eremiobacteraeota bacterium]